MPLQLNELGDSLPAFPPGRFIFDEPVGVGNHGQVMRAYDRQLRREVAIKLSIDPAAFQRVAAAELGELECGPELGAQLREAVAAVAAAAGRYTPLREARLLALVDHPNVVQVIDIGLIDERMAAVVMPYLGGGTLAERKFSRAWTETLDVALQIGWGLAAVHDAGLLHRDLKPNNILFDADGRPRIADLGLACSMRDREALAERVGTHAYMAPDAITDGCKDARDDVYAYCMIVYEMLNGRPPFVSAIERELGCVSASERHVPRALHEILARGLAPDAEERWPSMKALLRALERVRARGRGRRWPWIAAAALVVGIVIGSLVDERLARAAECEDVASEIEPIWNTHIALLLEGAFGTRKVSDGFAAWANRWLQVRAQECAAAQRDNRPTFASPCTESTRRRLDATLYAMKTPHLRAGLQFAQILAELPAPEHCLEHPDDAGWGYGGLQELGDLDTEVGVLLHGDPDNDPGDAQARQTDYMNLARQLNSRHGSARALYFRGEAQRSRGSLDEAEQDFRAALSEAIEIDAHVLAAECELKLASIAAQRGHTDVVEVYATIARDMFARHQPDRVPDVLQVHGLALTQGPIEGHERGLELLRHAVELCEDQLQQSGDIREPLARAHESLARGLLAVGRTSEALEYLDLALDVRQKLAGHGSPTTHEMLRLKFEALLELRQIDAAEAVERAIFKIDEDGEQWVRFCDDALWMMEHYIAAGEFEGMMHTYAIGRTKARKHHFHDHFIMFTEMFDKFRAAQAATK